MLGLSPHRIERLAPPEHCSAELCRWGQGANGIFLVLETSAFASACVPGALIVAAVPAPADYRQRCSLRALMDADDIARFGGATITETPTGVRIERAWPSSVRRAWTPQAVSAEADGQE